MNNLDLQTLTGAIGGYPVSIADVVARAVASSSTTELATMTIEEQSNVLLGIFNKYGKQVIFDLLGGWDNSLSRIFIRDTSIAGEFTELLSVDSDPEENVGDDTIDNGTDLLDIAKPKVFSSVIKLEFAKKWFVSVSFNEIRKAFTTEGGITTLTSLIMGSVANKAKVYLYNYTLEQLGQISKMLYIPKVVTDDTGTNVKFAAATIMKACRAMGRPSTEYNEESAYSQTNRDKLVMILDDTNDTASNIFVNASLFHSDKIGYDNIVSEVVSAPVAKLGNLVGLICDRDKFRIELMVNETYSFVNASNMTTKYYKHFWVKSGYNKALNGIGLINEASAIPAPRAYKDGAKLIVEKRVVNSELRYTDTGAAPSATSTLVPEGGITWVAGKTYKIAAVAILGDGTTKVTSTNVTSFVA